MRVYVCITGDLFHHGHISFFKKARKYGEHLIVGVCSDEAVKFYKRPTIMNLAERVAVIECCNLVNEVIPNVPAETTEHFINDHKIDLVVATNSYSKETLNLYYSDPQRKGILKLVDYKKGISTSIIIKRCAKLFTESKGLLKKL